MLKPESRHATDTDKKIKPPHHRSCMVVVLPRLSVGNRVWLGESDDGTLGRRTNWIDRILFDDQDRKLETEIATGKP